MTKMYSLDKKRIDGAVLWLFDIPDESQAVEDDEEVKAQADFLDCGESLLLFFNPVELSANSFTVHR